MKPSSFNLSLIFTGIIVLGLIIIVKGAVFVVDPTELAGVRRFGRVVTTEPLEPGLHFKLPLIDVADTLQISLDTFKVNELTVYTVDNQPVTISVSMTYRIPKRAVLKLLYEVGRAGAFDIDENIRPVISDRIMKVFAKMNTTKISEQREQTGSDIKALVTQGLNELFGMEVVDLQISAIKYSKTFEASVEAAVKAKNDAIAAENTVRRIEYEGKQKVVTAKAEAEALLARAEADKKAKILAAEGEARAIELQGEARAKALRLQAEAVKGSSELVEITKAERWTGQLPTTVLGNAVPFFSVESKIKP
jgi:regulator of protease activity HflC (stomatin/prohibitin superfamily)